MDQNMLSIYPKLTRYEKDFIKESLLGYWGMPLEKKKRCLGPGITDQILMFCSRDYITLVLLYRAWFPTNTIESALPSEIEILEKLGVW